MPILRSLANKAAKGTSTSHEDLLQEAIFFSLRLLPRWNRRYKFTTYLYANQPYAYLRWKAISNQAACTFCRQARRTKAAKRAYTSYAFVAANSLQAPLPNGNEQNRNLEELIAQSAFPAPDDTQAEYLQQIRNAVDTLDERSAEVIRRRYGLETGERETLKEIGIALNLTKERVRQIELSSLRRLRVRVER